MQYWLTQAGSVDKMNINVSDFCLWLWGGKRRASSRRWLCSLYSPCTARSCSSVVQREFILGAGWERAGEREVVRRKKREGWRWLHESKEQIKTNLSPTRGRNNIWRELGKSRVKKWEEEGGQTTERSEMSTGRKHKSKRGWMNYVKKEGKDLRQQVWTCPLLHLSPVS